MSDNNKPVKRNENLVVLSHEHHHGLVFCSRLKKANKADDQVLKSFVKEFWDNQLASHFESEESLLLPLLQDNKIAEQFLSEHDRIRKLIQAISENQNKNVKEDALKLGILINDHIRFEERTMFPWLEKTITPNELIAIGNHLEETEVVGHQFLPEFWNYEN
jgi:hemerythrin-like domain-containing protein